MTKNQMEQLAQRQLDAYNARDLESFCECFHQEVTILPLLTGRPSCQGMDAFRQSYQGLFSSSPELHCELKNRVVLGASIIDEEWITGAVKYPDGLHAVVIYGFRDEKIDRVWISR